MNNYYKSCAFPKPVDKKKKKKVNGYKDKPNRYCAICGRSGAERHEIFGGPLRQISIDYGFQIDLCRDHHAEFHAQETEEIRNEVLRLRKECQFRFEDELIRNDMAPGKAHEKWMELIGKNYL